MGEKQLSSKLKKLNLRTYTMPIVLVLLWIGFTFLTSDNFSDLSGSFISARNLSNLSRQMAMVGVMSVSMVLVIVTGGIDLSAGSLMGFCGCVAAYLMYFGKFPVVMSILVAILIGLSVGFVQGTMIAHTGVPAFIVTLAGQLVFRGAIVGLTRGTTISPLPTGFLVIGQSYIPNQWGYIIGIVTVGLLLYSNLNKRAKRKLFNFQVPTVGKTIFTWAVMSVVIIGTILIMNQYKGVPTPVLIMMVLVVIFSFIAEKTTFGRKVYAIGGNKDAARYSGINVEKTIVSVYLLNGLMAGFAGVILTSRLNAGMVSAGESFELDAIAACVIGGTSMSGGSGKVTGAILGALVMASITNGMSMMNLEAFWQYIVKGLILVFAVWFDMSNKRRANKVKQV